jgi:hypothetical protein
MKMGFSDDFVPDEEKVDKMAKFKGAKGGTLSLKGLQPGEYVDIKIKSIEKVVNAKTLQYNKNGGLSAVIEINGFSGKSYTGLEMNLWLSDNLRISMAAELRRRKTPVTEEAILGSHWRIFSTQNKQNRVYSAILIDRPKTQPESGDGFSAEDIFK